MGRKEEDLDATTEPLFFDRGGASIDLAVWQRLRQEPGYRLLGRTRVGRFEVVTVWLGTDQGPLGDEDRPLVFGTVALDLGHDSRLFEDREWLAPSEEEALRNHAALVHLLS